MPSPDSDIDDQLRAAMKVLDDEVPSSYWEALPNQTLARLEGSMQQGTSGTTNQPATSAPPMGATPPSATDNTEDSGLHDIRNLAQSTKQRLSSKRVTTSPPHEDDIASSSAGWKAVALPQPAKMVSLPELAELPSKKEIKAAEKAAAKAMKAEDVAVGKAVAKAAAIDAPASPAESMPARQAFALPSTQRAAKKSKAPLYALVGIGVAAAAGAVIFVTTQKSNKAAPAATQVARAEQPAPVATSPAAVGGAAGSGVVSADVQKAQDDVAKAEADAAAMRAQLATTAATGAAAPPVVEKPVKTTVTKKGHAKIEKTVDKPEETKQATPPVDNSKADKTKQKNADGSDPDFNELLKEAGVDPNKKEAKPKLDKKSLTGDDFKNGMSAVDGTAHSCYKGTSGTVMVKLAIAPTGKISSIKVTGAFAGKPEAACVAAAVRGVSFPPWDGHPESFTYPILLSE